MRDYLFRGKSRFSGKFVYGSLIHVGEFCCILGEDDGTDFEYPYLDVDLGVIDGQADPVIPETVGQFTGICDKDGKKIFEGDILQEDDIDREMEVVRFINGRYAPFNVYPEYYCWDKDECTVIGNIYDNPELLKGV